MTGAVRALSPLRCEAGEGTDNRCSRGIPGVMMAVMCGEVVSYKVPVSWTVAVCNGRIVCLCPSHCALPSPVEAA